MKAKVNNIMKAEVSTSAFFTGKSSEMGYKVTITFLESAPGMFYLGNSWNGIADEGKTISFNLIASSEGEVIHRLQQAVDVTNYKLVSDPVEKWEIVKDDRGVYMNTGIFFDSSKEGLAYIGNQPKFPDLRQKQVFVFENPICTDAENIINLTQHSATADQSDAGVVEPDNKAAVQAALTFDAIPSAEEMEQRAKFLAAVAVDSGCKRAMIGGAPFFMSTLERALISSGITPVYAFSIRESVEHDDGTGVIRKTNAFRHAGFVEI